MKELENTDKKIYNLYKVKNQRGSRFIIPEFSFAMRPAD